MRVHGGQDAAGAPGRERPDDEAWRVCGDENDPVPGSQARGTQSRGLSDGLAAGQAGKERVRTFAEIDPPVAGNGAGSRLAHQGELVVILSHNFPEAFRQRLAPGFS